jgi:PAS domain S-box-containing protein
MQPHIAVVLTDATRSITWVNHDFTLMTGYSLQDVIGKKPSLLQGTGTSESDVKRIREQFESKQSFKDSIVNYTKEGREYKCNFVIHPILDEKDEISNYIAFEVDASQTDDTHLPLLQLREKYSTSSLKTNDQTSLYVRLCAVVQQEKLYIDPNLSLRELANRLHTNTRYLSQVINSLSGYNLQHFINTHRIEDVKKAIMSDDFHNHTLYGIAQRCGFKNKSTFFKVFKEVTGLTPKDYLKQYHGLMRKN